jgi:hypothetical protein
MSPSFKFFRISICCLAVLISTFPAKSQEAVRQRSALTTGGSSGTVAINGRSLFLQQSIGQQGITGLSGTKSYLIRQGFIQPLATSAGQNKEGSLAVTILPNPFSQHLKIYFSEEIRDVYVSVINMEGRIMFLKHMNSARELDTDLGMLAPGVYTIRINTISDFFTAKVIKQ